MFIPVEWVMSLKIDRTFLYKLHTGTLLLLLLAVSVVTVLRVHPVVSVLSVLLGVLSLFLYGLKGELRALVHFCLPIGILLILFNLVFNRNGVTALFYLGDSAVTLEAFVYALLSALSFTGAVLWFSFFCALLDADRIYDLFSGLSKGFAVIFSLSMALVPKTMAKYDEMRSADLDANDKQKRFTKLILHLSALFSWVLEDSFETASSMKARGALLPGKRQRLRRPISAGDVLVCFLGAGGLAAALFSAPLKITVYPKLRIAAYFENGAFWYLPVLLLYLIPCIWKLWEVLKWKSVAQNM